ncbi:polysaccharide biosynthesis C-terminal domain-containing protein, partial [Candidatus Micrarchaeota archaeon]|nr:polysaccharide biosynthesis C-terminal domain-containing protein [Candidatus Micrarchaeota archaeon]
TKEKISIKEVLTELAPFGLLLAAIQSFSVIVSSLDRLILGYLSNPAEAAKLVATYSIATNLATVLMLFGIAIGNIFVPMISRLAGENKLPEMRAVMETAQRWTLFLTLPAAAVMITFSQEILTIFYTSTYRSGALTMGIFTLGMVVLSIGYVTSLAIIAVRKIRIELYITVASAVINFILNLLLIPYFGMEGAALAGLIGFVITTMMLNEYGMRLFTFKLPKETYKLLAAFIIVTGILIMAKPLFIGVSSFIPTVGQETWMGPYLTKIFYLTYLGIVMVLTMTAFFLGALWMKCFKGEDSALTKKILRRIRMPEWAIVLASRIMDMGIA